MATFRAYTTKEIRDAAQAYDLDPDFVEAVYAVESSRGTNPKAMTARSVKRKRDSTIVRGPFQLEDDTTSDLIKKHKLGNVDVNDPDVHLDLALRLMRDLKDTYNGDYNKVARAYLGGPGGVADTTLKDELGTSTGGYGNKVMSEMSRLKTTGEDLLTGAVGGPAPAVPARTPAAPAMVQPPAEDLFGLSASADSDRVKWSDLVAANRSPGSEFSLPAGVPDMMPSASEDDFAAYIQRIVNEEFDGKQFSHA